MNIHTPNALNVKKYFIVVASSYYNEIKEQLEEYGLREFENFIYAGIYGKKIALLHGNCHMQVIKNILMNSEEFTKEYDFYPLPFICENKKGCIDDCLLQKCSLFIHQNIHKDNKFSYLLSDEYLLPRLPDMCRVIAVPNLFRLGFGFFPQFISQTHIVPLDGDSSGMFPFGDYNINKFYEEGYTIHEITAMVEDENLYSHDFIQENFKDFLEKIVEREKGWDIKISDYIIKNYRTNKIFYDPNHPTNFVLAEVARRLLRLLGYHERLVIDRQTTCLDTHEIPIYFCVKKALGLVYPEKYIRCNSQKKLDMDKKMDLAEYIREYIYWCYCRFMFLND